MLGLPTSYTIDDALDILDFNGEVFGCRLPIIIDGLNEAAPHEDIWKYELTMLKSRVESRNNLLIITTCREKEDYIKVIYGMDDYKSVPNYIHLKGIERKYISSRLSKFPTSSAFNVAPEVSKLVAGTHEGAPK